MMHFIFMLPTWMNSWMMLVILNHNFFAQVVIVKRACPGLPDSLFYTLHAMLNFFIV